MKKQKLEISDYCDLQIQGVEDMQYLLNGKIYLSCLILQLQIRFIDLVHPIEGEVFTSIN